MVKKRKKKRRRRWMKTKRRQSKLPNTPKAKQEKTKPLPSLEPNLSLCTVTE
jgi:hypothetical protein